MFPVLDIRNLRKCHAARKPAFCADIPRLSIYPGQAGGIAGPSGCGKSTLLEMLALLTRPTAADVFHLWENGRRHDLAALWKGSPHSLAAIRRINMGFIHQSGGLYPFLSVRDNIRLSLSLSNSHTEATHARRVDELLDFLGLNRVADSLPETLSYGERQRTAVARALVHRPQLILADEPTSALDPDAARITISLLLEGAQHSGAALLVVSHDHALLTSAGIPVMTMCDVPLENGEIHYALAAPTTLDICQQNVEENASPPTVPDATRMAKEKISKPHPRLILSLAWKDFCYERALSLCAVLAFAAALTPLMVLGGLRAGIITTLSQRLMNNPAALAVNPYSSQRYTGDDIAALGAHPAVAFIVPRTRTLASTVHVSHGDHAITADIVPTAPGDPLLERYASTPPVDGAVLTRELARSLPSLNVGDTLTLAVSRRVQGRPEQAMLRVRVHAILPDAADWKAHIYLHHPLLLDIERYRDGSAVPARGWPGMPETDAEPIYAGFRMYVKSLEDVVPIRDALKDKGIDAYTFAREVETIQGLRQALTLTTLLIGGVTLAGMAFSLASLAVANIRRKARFFAQGSLMGLYSFELLLFPLLQMSFIALLAATFSLLLYNCAGAILDLAAAPWLQKGESACRLPMAHLALLYAGSLALSCLCGISACRQLLSLQPAEVLRRDA